MEIGPWKCDTCGKSIENVEDGWVEWLRTSDGHGAKTYGLRLVHHKPASPRKTAYGCQYNETEKFESEEATLQDMPLSEYVGAKGLMNLLEMIAENEMPVEDIVEMIKRLHIPLYEKARPYISAALREGVFEPNSLPGFYTEGQMLAVISWAESEGRF